MPQHPTKRRKPSARETLGEIVRTRPVQAGAKALAAGVQAHFDPTGSARFRIPGIPSEKRSFQERFASEVGMAQREILGRQQEQETMALHRHNQLRRQMAKIKNSPGVTLEAPATPWPTGNGAMSPKMPTGVTKGVGAKHTAKSTTNRGLTGRKSSYWQK